MRPLKNIKFWSQGTFFKNLGSPFLNEASQDYPHERFGVSSIPYKVLGVLKPHGLTKQSNYFAQITNSNW